MPAGRPKALTIDDELIAKVERLAAQGLIMDQIADCLGISDATLYKGQNENPDLADAIKRGRASGIKDVTNALFTKAVEGDTTAQIFYLKNRQPDAWLDSKHVKNTGTVEIIKVQKFTD